MLDNHICTLAVSLQNYYVSGFILFQREEGCIGGERPTTTQAHYTTALQNFKPRNTHSLLRFSRPVKAPLVSSIVPEMSLWSSSLGRGQERAHNRCLTPRLIVKKKWKKVWNAIRIASHFLLTALRKSRVLQQSSANHFSSTEPCWDGAFQREPWLFPSWNPLFLKQQQ